MNNTLLYLVTVLVWGSTWIAIEFQVDAAAVEVSVFYRYACASVLLLAICRLLGRSLRFHWRDHLLFAALGVCLFGLNFVLAYSAQQYIGSAMSAIAFSSMLWMNILNARLFFGTAIEPRVVAGSVLGIAGIVCLFYPQIRQLDGGTEVLLGAGLCVAGAMTASLGNMVSQAAQKKALPVLQSNAWGMLYGALLTGLFAFGQGREFKVDWEQTYFWSMLYLIVFGSIVAFSAYLTLLGRIGAQRAGYAVIMFPVVAVLLSVAFEGLAVTAGLLAGVALVGLGNLVTLGWNRSAA